jgi:trans-aconitate methyltransferase
MNVSEILRRHQSDKATHHSYGPLYDVLLSPYRECAKNVLELGILEGCSLRAWQEFFPNATIHGIDNEAHRLVHDEPRIVSHHVDTKERDRFIDVCNSFPLFDVIFDDASHVITEQIWAACCLWGRLAPGGIYIIEDILYPQYLPLFQAFQNVELYDLRHVRGQHDDLVAVMRKSV